MKKVIIGSRLKKTLLATCLTTAIGFGVWENVILAAEPETINAATTAVQQETTKQESVEGKTVVKVAVQGNKLIESGLLESVVSLKPGMSLTKQALDNDLQAIYSLGWFYDVQPEYNLVPEGVQVVYRVLENPIFSKLEIQGNSVYKNVELANMITLPKNKIINSVELNKSIRAIEAKYKQDGYILTRISDVKMNEDGALKLTVNEGNVEGFSVKGNKKTKAYVVTREMRLKVGKPFNSKDARRSIQRIYNLGYFEDVNVKLNPGRNPNAVEVEVSVVEMNTGTFGIGAGYSNSDGFVGIVSLGDKNFRGTGDKVNIRWEFGGESNKNYEFGYVRPWLDKKETALGLSIYDATNEYQEYNDDSSDKARYDKKRRGYELTLSRPQSEHVTNFVTYKDREDTYVKAIEGHEPQYYRDNPGKISENFGLTRSVTLMRVVDTRDSVHNPSEGTKVSVGAEFAGMSGDFNFNKYFLDSRWYFKQNNDHVIAVKFDAGYADGTMPLSQRFSLGGAETLRGYKDDQFKGYKMMSGTLEYRFPVVKKVQGVVFSDAGYAWNKGVNMDLSDIKTSIGVGFRITSPLGPVRLDYAIGEEEGRFHFSFGGQF